MSVNFELNSYTVCFSYKTNEKKFFKEIGEKLQFSHDSITRQEFNEVYSPEGWLGRKFIALPAMVWSGVVKTTYHLAKAILIGVPKAFSDKGLYLKKQFFYAARDLQESYGRLTSFFNDRYGQFHIQDSGFHKSCYDCLVTDHSSKIDSSILTDEEKSKNYNELDKVIKESLY